MDHTDTNHTTPASDAFVKFEVMDRAATLQSMLGTLLDDHVGLDNGDIREKYEAAGKAIADLYQSAAAVVFPK